MKRLDFIKATAIVAPAAGLFPDDLSWISRISLPGKIEKRSLGKTGEMLSVMVRPGKCFQLSDSEGLW